MVYAAYNMLYRNLFIKIPSTTLHAVKALEWMGERYGSEYDGHFGETKSITTSSSSHNTTELHRRRCLLELFYNQLLIMVEMDFGRYSNYSIK